MAENRPDIALAICPPWGVINPPLGLAYLATTLEQNRFKTKIFDLNIKLYQTVRLKHKKLWEIKNDHNWRSAKIVTELFDLWCGEIDRILNSILRAGAPVIGFSIVDPNEIFTCKAMQSIKKKTADRIIIAGGPGCSSPGQRRFINETSGYSVDFFVEGEGEFTLVELLKSLPSAKNLSHVPGIVPAERADMHIEPAHRPDLDSIPFPTFKDFNMPEYGRQSLAVIWSRGCIGRCLYCKEKALWGKYRTRTVASIIDELRYHIQHHGIRNFVVYDSAVNGNPHHLEKICDAIISSSLNIKWSAEAIALRSLSESLLKKMRSAGCHTLVYGIESGSDHVLQKMGKITNVRTASAVLKHTHEAGIKVAINILIGFPGEQENEFNETLDFMRHNRAWIDRLDGVSTLQVVTDTPLHRQAGKLGIIFPENEPHNRWYTVDGNTFEVRQKRLKQVLRLAKELGLEIGRTFLENDKIKTKGFKRSRKAGRLWQYLADRTELNPEIDLAHEQNFFERKILKMFGKTGLINPITKYDIPLMQGIEDGSKAFAAPEVIHLDLTNRCNLNCIACWCQSPLLEEQAMTPDQLNSTLAFDIVANLIDDITDMGGVRQIKLGGGGEPTLHPRFNDIITYINNRDRNIQLDINTNFTRFDETLINRIIELEVDLLTVSLWSGTPTGYAKTHPNQKEKSFNRIVHRLKMLTRHKKNGLPRISIHNVIMNLNYHEVQAMLDLALDIGVDEISYVLVDPVPGKTDRLLLNRREKLTLLKTLKQYKKHIDYFDKYVDPRSGRVIKITNYFELLRRLSESDTDKGSYDKKVVERVPCYIGWLYARIMADGKVAPCCKGHRMIMGNLYEKRFKEIWHSSKYTRFRQNGLSLKKSAPYFSVMGNDQNTGTGCYNCDNLMHNIVMHRKILSHSNISKWAKFEMLHWIRRWF